jgi:hypothetical protein
MPQELPLAILHARIVALEIAATHLEHEIFAEQIEHHESRRLAAEMRSRAAKWKLTIEIRKRKKVFRK